MSKLLPYETIVKAHEGDLEAIDTVLSHYAGYIRYFSKVHGQVKPCSTRKSFRRSCTEMRVFIDTSLLPAAGCRRQSHYTIPVPQSWKISILGRFSYFVDIREKAQKCAIMGLVHRWIIPIE